MTGAWPKTNCGTNHSAAPQLPGAKQRKDATKIRASQVNRFSRVAFIRETGNVLRPATLPTTCKTGTPILEETGGKSEKA
jgi:hypothetical protein